MDTERKNMLEDKCRHIRYLIMDEIGKLGVGHLGGCMSVVEALVVVYYSHLRADPENQTLEGRDRFILSKGHAGPALYAVLADRGYFPLDWLDTLNRSGTNLPSHADMRRTPGVDMTTGSLGQGFSCAVGIALGARLRQDGANAYVIIGDGESDEGIIWEAAMFAAHRKLSNLIAFTDYNKMQLDGATDQINSLEPIEDKWRAFGWNTFRVDGHNVEAIDAAVCLAKAQNERPSMIILDTLKGKGVSFLEAAWENNHNVAITSEQHAQALQELKGGVRLV